MKLKIKNPEARAFDEKVGITEKRGKLLIAKLDELGDKLKGQSPLVFDVFNEIAGFCRNKEELVYCSILHCNYVSKNFGAVLTPVDNEF